MKQRIRGLVSLHEIPFSSRALQREEGNWPHYTKREGEGGVCGDWGGRWKGGGAKKSFLNTLLFFTSPVFPQCHSAWLPPPPVTSHIAIQEVFLGLPFFWQGEEVGGVTLALKPAMVLPPGQTTRQLSKRKRVITVRMRESWESRGGTRLPWWLAERCEHACLSVGRASVHGGPSNRADVCARAFVCACVYQHVGEDAHVQTDSKTHKLTLPQLSL